MSHEIAGTLPSLAHPLIINPAQGVESYGGSLCLPPFPEIDLLNYEGFHISLLHWVALSVAELPLPNPESGELKRAYRHEFGHDDLRRTPFSCLRDHEGIILYERIVTTFEEGKEQIPVPLRPDLLRNELEKQWDRVVRFTRASRLIEEVYAVRSSLVWARDEGLISPKQFTELTTDYKNGYGEIIPGYAAVYTLFDVVARHIGETAATALIQAALGTIIPEAAFVEMLFYLCQIGIRVPVKGFPIAIAKFRRLRMTPSSPLRRHAQQTPSLRLPSDAARRTSAT